MDPRAASGDVPDQEQGDCDRTVCRPTRMSTMSQWIAAIVLGLAVASAPAGARQAPGAPQAAPGDELPEGDGKQILVAACTSCHDLGEVTKFQGYWDRAQWRAAVVTMVEYGAPVEAPQIDVLADYLYEHLGKRPDDAAGTDE